MVKSKATIATLAMALGLSDALAPAISKAPAMRAPLRASGPARATGAKLPPRLQEELCKEKGIIKDLCDLGKLCTGAELHLALTLKGGFEGLPPALPERWLCEKQVVGQGEAPASLLPFNSGGTKQGPPQHLSTHSGAARAAG